MKSDVVDIIILNLNRREFLRLCLESVFNQSFRRFEVIVVDNGSTDGSVDFVRSKYPEVRVISLGENKGFSAAANVGIRESKGELVALLNNDIEADPGWLEALVGAADEHRWAGFFATKMLKFSQREVLDGAGDAYLRFGGARRIGHGEPDRGQYDEPREVLGACAGAALYRRDLFNVIGLFDEDFFAFLEDVDLSLRAQWAGFRCLYVPAARAYHAGGGTAPPDSALAIRLRAQNRWSVAVKNLPMRVLIYAVPLMFVAECYHMVRSIRHGKGLSYCKGLVSMLGLLPWMLAKRRQVLERACLSPGEFSARLRRADREAVESLIRSAAYPRAVTKLLQWYLGLWCRGSPDDFVASMAGPFRNTNCHRPKISQIPH